MIESLNIAYVLQKDPSTTLWKNMSDMVEIKIVPKSTELKIRTKMVSSLMLIISAKNLSEEIFPDLASAIISANQGHVANFSVLKNERRPDTFRVIQSKMEISAQEDFKIATNFRMILKPGMKMQTLSQRLMFANPEGFILNQYY